MVRTLAIKRCDLSSIPGKHMVQGENQLPQAAAWSDDIIGGIRSLLFSEASPITVVPCGSKEEKQSRKEDARLL